MPRNGSGTYSLPGSSWNPAVDGTIIDSSDWNTQVAADLSGALTQSVSKDGQTPWTGNMQAGNNKITGLANGTSATDAVNFSQLVSKAYELATAGGTADAITLTVGPPITSYASPQEFWFLATGTNTTAVTVAVSGLSTKAVQANSAALVAGDIVSGRFYGVKYDGTNFQLLTSHASKLHPADLAADASTGAVRAVVGTTDTILATDRGKLVTYSNGSSIAVTLPQATGGFVSPFYVSVRNLGVGTVTITPTTSTIDGAASLALTTGQSADIYSDSTNYSTTKTPTVTFPLPTGYLYGLTLSNNGSDANNDIDVSSGSCRDSTDADNMVLAAITKRLDATWVVGTNQGGLDTGVKANTTWYHVWVIKRVDTGVVDVLFSLSVSAPTMPANYTLKRRIGSIITDGSGNLRAFIQLGDVFRYVTPIQDVSINNLSTTAVLYTLSTPLGYKARPLVRTLTGNTSAVIILTSPDETDSAASATESVAPGFDLGGGDISTQPFLYTNTSSQIRARASAAASTLYINTRGWIDTRNREQ